MIPKIEAICKLKKKNKLIYNQVEFDLKNANKF